MLLLSIFLPLFNCLVFCIYKKFNINNIFFLIIFNFSLSILFSIINLISYIKSNFLILNLNLNYWINLNYINIKWGP